MSQKNTYLELKNIKKTFNSDLFAKKTEVLKGLSCKFLEGTTTAIIGHNGAGKTTTIRVLLDMIKPDKGEILIKGRKLTQSDRLGIGYMPEVHRLTGALTPKETLSIHLRFFKKIAKKDRFALISKTLEKVGLLGHENKLLRNLSKGQQRRLAYGLATIHQPKLLILDEPFSGLDPLAYGNMEKWIQEEKDRGATIIMSSHQIPSIVKTCDQFHILKDGKIDYTSLSDDGTNHNISQDLGFTLNISGVDKKTVDGFVESNTIPSPLAWHNIDFQHTLSYPDYQQAMLALKVMVNEGIVVSSFSENTQISENLILSLLQKDNK